MLFICIILMFNKTETCLKWIIAFFKLYFYSIFFIFKYFITF